MTPFLLSVAGYLYSNKQDDFRRMRLVFPNRRSGVFFLKYLQGINEKNIWLPEVLTINELLEEQSSYELADQIELLVMLYRVYVKITKSNEKFDDFYFWGEIMLNDFNDVDKYNIDAAGVFSNVKELKNIDSGFNYLTENQKEVLKRFFSEFNPDEKSKLKESFLQIWNFLLSIYNEFHEMLNKKSLAYEGMLYQNARSNVVDKGVDEIPHQYCFIGFNAITKCEEDIFSHLQGLGKASFFWDYDEYYIKNKAFEAGFFMRNYVYKFKAPDDFKLENNALTNKKTIQVVSTPTNTGQVTLAGRFLHKNKQTDYSKSALVLADELLLQSVLNYLPTGINDVNITMGYPLKDTLAGNFIDLILRLKLLKGNKRTFYYKNVLPLLKHPYLSTLMPDESGFLLKKIKQERIVNLVQGDWQNEELFDLLFYTSKDVKEVAQNILQLVGLIQNKMKDRLEEGIFHLDYEQLFNVYLLLTKLNNQIENQNIELSLPVFIKLLKKMIYRLRVPFEGEPVKGLQVMGFLETRSLDFENLVILSVNDSLLPSSNVSPSFIPYSLRRGFDLPTRELHDAMYAYYFYRIIQRANNVLLVYNSGSSGMATGEKSRFVQQLLFDDNFEIEEKVDQYSIDVSVAKSIKIEKRGVVLEKLNEFIEGDSRRRLSPSALVTYLTCSLRFYYQQILRIRDEDELTESVDARLFGNIFHHAAEFLYESFVGKENAITQKVLDDLIKNDDLINSAIQNAFNRTFYGNKSERKFEIRGKNRLVQGIIRKYLIKMLSIDKNIAPITIVGLEQNLYKEVAFKVNGHSYKVQLGGFIDRLDKVGDSLRVLDYKTGSDILTFKQLEKVFESDKIADQKAVVQTLIYGLVVSHHYPEVDSVVPGVYKVKDFFNPKFDWRLRSFEEPAFAESNFKRIEYEVEEQVGKVLSELFDKEQPFVQTENEKHCMYCSFKDMCGK